MNIRLNANTGEWDWEDLANDWDAEQLDDWGLDIPNFEIEEEKEQIDLSDQLKEIYEVIISAVDEKQQEQIYNKLIGEGYQCRVLTL